MTTEIIVTLSSSRFQTYLHASGYDRDRALELYIWNAQVGAAFHVPVQAVEVALRNKVNTALVAEFGPDWWNERRFKFIIERERVRDIDTVITRMHKRGIPIETGQIIAGLSFGFWIGMLQARYNPTIWSKHLRSSFKSLPSKEGRDGLFKMGGQIANFRNRISHHEPLIKYDLLKKHSEILNYLLWLCPDTHKWIKPHCIVPKLVRQKP